MKANKKNRYRVMVRQTDEIAGEVVTSEVWVHCCPSLTVATEWAKARWGLDYPSGAHILDAKDGTVYQIFQNLIPSI